jgi:hypothetical protein
MRINFTGRYQEVADLLRASSKPVERQNDSAFEKSLGGLLLEPVENNEIKPTKQETYVPRQSLPDPLDDIRASLKLDAPKLEMPAMTPLEPPTIEVSEPLTPGVADVKTPTVIEAKRVEITTMEPIIEPTKISKADLQSRLVTASRGVGIDPALAQSVVSAESSFNINAVSKDGHASKGLFQLLDTTGKDLMSRMDIRAAKYDPFDPDLNINLGTSYLKYLHTIFQKSTDLPNNLQTRAAAGPESLEKFAVAAFNAGEGRVASAQERSEKGGKDPSFYEQVAPFLPRSTREYVSRVVEGKKFF